jgi:hypothetical protein
MSLQSRRQLENTRKKLEILQESLRSVETRLEGSPAARDLSRRSLKKLINQMKEEIARFEARASVRSDGA